MNQNQQLGRPNQENGYSAITWAIVAVFVFGLMAAAAYHLGLFSSTGEKPKIAAPAPAPASATIPASAPKAGAGVVKAGGSISITNNCGTQSAPKVLSADQVGNAILSGGSISITNNCNTGSSAVVVPKKHHHNHSNRPQGCQPVCQPTAAPQPQVAAPVIAPSAIVENKPTPKNGMGFAWMHPDAKKGKTNMCFFEERNRAGIYPEYCTKGEIVPKKSANETEEQWSDRMTDKWNNEVRKDGEEKLTKSIHLGKVYVEN